MSWDLANVDLSLKVGVQVVEGWSVGEVSEDQCCLSAEADPPMPRLGTTALGRRPIRSSGMPAEHGGQSTIP